CCAAWQTRDGAVNDHSDAAYDAPRIAALRSLHEESSAVLTGFAGAVPRFAGYPGRLALALARVEAGETKMFTGVMCGRYHDIWMELHEDLIQLLGVDRSAEGSF
ncbi:MAG: MarR family transcriptional regulator, partial [Actinomycetota bacterium]